MFYFSLTFVIFSHLSCCPSTIIDILWLGKNSRPFNELIVYLFLTDTWDTTDLTVTESFLITAGTKGHLKELMNPLGINKFCWGGREQKTIPIYSVNIGNWTTCKMANPFTNWFPLLSWWLCVASFILWHQTVPVLPTWKLMWTRWRETATKSIQTSAASTIPPPPTRARSIARNSKNVWRILNLMHRKRKGKTLCGIICFKT